MQNTEYITGFRTSMQPLSQAECMLKRSTDARRTALRCCGRQIIVSREVARTLTIHLPHAMSLPSTMLFGLQLLLSSHPTAGAATSVVSSVRVWPFTP